MSLLTTKQIQNYAKIFVLWALNGGKGIKEGETVMLFGHESAKELYMAVKQLIYESGGNVIQNYLPDEDNRYGLTRGFFEVASEKQLEFTPIDYYEGLVKQVDHVLFILSDFDVHALEGIASEKIMATEKARSYWMKLRREKEAQGEMSWTLGLWPTKSMADEAGLSEKEYAQQIIDACYLDEDDPVAKWQEIEEELGFVKKTLTEMQIEKLHVQGENIDLHVKLGENRKWMAGSGRNVPSYECFCSPDWRGTNGWARMNQPLYYQGKRISGIYMKFKDGIVVEASAEENDDALQKMLAEPNANKLGEYSLTDARHSRITKFMANTLYDENVGGKDGNTHFAVGNAYRDGYIGDVSKVTEDQWEEMGFNKCDTVHVDIMDTNPRTVTAYLKDGSKKVIYKDGMFTFLKS